MREETAFTNLCDILDFDIARYVRRGGSRWPFSKFRSLDGFRSFPYFLRCDDPQNQQQPQPYNAPGPKLARQ